MQKLLLSLLLACTSMAIDAKRPRCTIDAMEGLAVSGIPGGVWADNNGDGCVDGYLFNGRFIAGKPTAASNLKVGEIEAPQHQGLKLQDTAVGVYISEDPQGRAGSMLTAVNGVSVSTAAQARDVINSAHRANHAINLTTSRTLNTYLLSPEGKAAEAARQVRADREREAVRSGSEAALAGAVSALNQSMQQSTNSNIERGPIEAEGANRNSVNPYLPPDPGLVGPDPFAKREEAAKPPSTTITRPLSSGARSDLAHRGTAVDDTGKMCASIEKVNEDSGGILHFKVRNNCSKTITARWGYLTSSNPGGKLTEATDIRSGGFYSTWCSRGSGCDGRVMLTAEWPR